MNTRTPRMTPHCRVIVSGASFALNSTSSRPDLSLAPSLVGIRRTREAMSPSSSWISSVDQVVNSLKKTVPKHDLWKGWIVTAVSLSDRIDAIFFSASMAEGTSFTRNWPGLEGLQDRTRPHFDSVERTWIVWGRVKSSNISQTNQSTALNCYRELRNPRQTSVAIICDQLIGLIFLRNFSSRRPPL